jgi:hypothetical protein
MYVICAGCVACVCACSCVSMSLVCSLYVCARVNVVQGNRVDDQETCMPVLHKGTNCN